MNDPAGTAIAVLAALGAAGSFGVAAALQHRQAQLGPKSGGLSFRLLARLAGRPRWLAGAASAIAGITVLGRYAGPPAIRNSTNQDHLAAGARGARHGQPASRADSQRPALEGRTLR
jgi:hypothetical protein